MQINVIIVIGVLALVAIVWTVLLLLPAAEARHADLEWRAAWRAYGRRLEAEEWTR